MSCGVCAILIAFMMPAVGAVSVSALARVGTQANMKFASNQNVIRQIVDMLKELQEKVNEQWLSEKSKWEETECLCKKALVKQGAIVKSMGEEIPGLEKQYKNILATIHIVEHEWDAANKALMETSKSARELKAVHMKEHGATVKQMDEYRQNIAAMQKAIDALNKGMQRGRTFLQTDTASTEILNNIVVNADLSDDARDIVTAFLDQSSLQNGETPGTSEIVGVLKQMKETMQGELDKIELVYTRENAAYLAQMKTLEDLIAEYTETVMVKGKRKAELMMEMLEIKAKLNSLVTSEYIAAQKLYFQIKASCEAAEDEWIKMGRVLKGELMAITDAIHLLGDDDAMDLFRKVLDGVEVEAASFLQLEMTHKQLAKRAQKALSGFTDRDYRVRAISYLMEGRRLDMTKVLRMIQELVDLLKQEAIDEAEKRDTCIHSIRENEHAMDLLNTELKPVKSVIEDLQNQLDDLDAQINLLQSEINDLNAFKDKITKIRNEEKALYEANLAADSAALHTLKTAKLALTNFYDKHQAFFVQLLSRYRARYTPKSDHKVQDASGVIGMIQAVIANLELTMAEDKKGEENAVNSYNVEVKLINRDLSQKQKVMGELKDDHAFIDDRLQKYKDEKQHLFDEEMRLDKILAALHADCDFLIANFVVRTKAREGEIESLENSKIVLLGALPSSFVQVEQAKNSARPRKLSLSMGRSTL